MLIEKRTQSVVDTLDSETIQINLEREASFDFSSLENITSSSLFSLSGFEEHHAIGVIYSPEIEMEVPIFKGLSNTDLFVGAGTMKEEQCMGEGNYALASHNWRDQTTLFSALHRAEKGMSLFLTDLENIYEYEIDVIEMVHPNRIDLIEDTDETILTLVTCNHDGTERLIVQATLVSQTPNN